MISSFSKPSADILKESSDRIELEHELWAAQASVASTLKDCGPRLTCALCGESLSGERISYRNVDFIFCNLCGHLQTEAEPPEGYPSIVAGPEFNQIYPELSAAEFADRRERIYRPKLEWIVDSLERLGEQPENTIRRNWLDLGCGAGGFLSSLSEAGVKQACGIESEEKLVSEARRHLPDGWVHHWPKSLASGIRSFEGSILTAFFVFEHIRDLTEVWESLRELPSGTILCFSVPTFGFTSLWEAAFPDVYARCLDAVVHTQIFTDESLNHAMDTAGFRIEAQWFFGQDAVDLARVISVKLGASGRTGRMATLLKSFHKQVDSFQAEIDKVMLCDQRHVLAIKE